MSSEPARPAAEESEEEFLARYDLRRYTPQAVTADIAIFTIHEDKLKCLVIKRGGHPEKGKMALPGGFANVDESIDQAAARELLEETSIPMEAGFLEQLKTYAWPGRDPRGYIATVAYVALVPALGNSAIAADDAETAKFVPVDEILADGYPMAFNHKEIFLDALERIRAKLEYTPLASKFVEGDTVTVSELRRIYEIVWGHELNTSNFRRKILSVKGWLTESKGTKTPKVAGTRRSQHYHVNEVPFIYPPLRRSRFEH